MALLSWFDGVGTAAWALQSAGITPFAYFSWEDHGPSQELASAHFPGVVARGDFARDSAADIIELVTKAALPPDGVLLCAAGPPCPDYTRIKGAAAPGRVGKEGRKFADFAALLGQLRKASPWRLFFLVENVLPADRSEAAFFDEALGVPAVVVDAAGFGLIRRPRLWWSDIPVPPALARSGTFDGYPKLTPEGPRVNPSDIDADGFHFHPDVVAGKATLPTLTTPAPTDEGRPPPRGALRGRSPGTVARWEEGRRQYAPWHYDKRALMWQTADATGAWRVPPPDVKEQLHCLPSGYTAATGACQRTRATWLANGWHGGVARFWLLCFAAAIGPAAPCGWGTAGPAPEPAWSGIPAAAMQRIPLVPPRGVEVPPRQCIDTSPPFGCSMSADAAATSSAWVPAGPGDPPRASRRSPRSDPEAIATGMGALGASRLDQLRALLAARTLRFVAPGGRVKQGATPLVAEARCPQAHLAAAKALPHPFSSCAQLEPAALWAVDFYAALGSGVVRWRAQVLDEVATLVEDLAPQVREWRKQLGPHVRDAYRSTQSPCVPVLAALLDVIGYPGREALLNDITLGFDLLGPLTPGCGWRQLPEPYPAKPMPLPEFRETNLAYIKRVASSRSPGPHSNELLDEVLKERAMGRMYGPLRAPAHWGFQTAALPPRLACAAGGSCSLTAAPTPSPAAALAFPIVTEREDGTPKVRRGEDWRRSAHNATCQVVDSPAHHGVDWHVALAQALHARGVKGLHAWGHDHDGAYRQLALRRPADACMLLHTDFGPTLWCHTVLLFGSKGSVWAYGRVADALVAVARCLLVLPCGHFVDDFGGVESETTAASGATGFADLNKATGFRMKLPKAVGPAPEVPLLGTQLRLSAEAAVCAPKSSRLRKVSGLIARAIDSDTLTPEQAGSLAGKVSFLTGTCHGRVGRAACRPLFARQHQQGGLSALSPALRASLPALADILATAPPRWIPLGPDARGVPILYADACFSAGERECRPGQPGTWPDAWSPAAAPCLANSWGFVLFPPGPGAQPLYAAGSVPPELLARFATRKAFIFLLEAIAQCLPLWALWPLLRLPYWAFVDNTAAQHALTKGYSRNPGANYVVALYWGVAARVGAAPWLERVASKANLSDAVSRLEFDTAVASGWRRLEFDFVPAFSIIARGVESGQWDIGADVSAILADLTRQRLALGFAA